MNIKMYEDNSGGSKRGALFLIEKYLKYIIF